MRTMSQGCEPMTEMALFDEPTPDWSHDEWTVREVSPETIKRWVIDWHYSHRTPGGGTVGYGVFCPDMIGIITVSTATNAHGVAKKLGLEDIPGNYEISRVVCHPDAPKNTASRSIAACFPAWRQRGWQWLFSYADTGQNHHGGIYQALNSIYCGISEARPGYLHDGVPMHPRTVVSVYGTQAWPKVREIAERAGHTIEKIDNMNTAKHLYVVNIGTPAQRKLIRKRLKPIQLPYPKRDVS